MDYVWSLDISTTNIGFALWNIEGKLIELKHLELKIDKNTPIEQREICKAELFRNYVTDYKLHILNELNGQITTIIVEEPLGGSNNAFTVSLLFGFNAICRYILFKEFNVHPLKISVYDSRKNFLREFVHIKKVKGEITEVLSFPKGWKSAEKKKCVWEKVVKLEPQIEWFYKKDTNEPKDICYDMSDSYCCGYAYFRQTGILK